MVYEMHDLKYYRYIEILNPQTSPAAVPRGLFTPFLFKTTHIVYVWIHLMADDV